MNRRLTKSLRFLLYDLTVSKMICLLKVCFFFFVQMTGDEFNDLEKDEVNIISGALELHRKKVNDVMTKLEDVYMLSYDTVLDFETVSEIMKSGK